MVRHGVDEMAHARARPTPTNRTTTSWRAGYRYADGSPVDLMRVKSLITAPRDGERVNVVQRA
jgi:hypothetical protein